MRFSKSILIIVVVVTALVFATGCEKGKNSNEVSNQTTDSSHTEKISANNNMSDYLSKILNITNIKKIVFENKTNCKIIFRDGKFCNFNISDKLISLKLDKKDYLLVFQEDGFIVNNLTDKINIKYFNIGEFTENIDRAITTSIAIMTYLEEIGNIDYEENGVLLYTHEWTHWCIHPRKSFCTKERALATATKHCGHVPSYISATDCGCLWGDFLCVCLTDFDC